MNFAFIQGIGPTELIIVLVIVLLIFGPKRLPSLARSVGTGMREFKDSVTGRVDRDDEEDAVTSGPVADDAARAEAQAALGRPKEAEAELGREGEPLSDRR
jgi:sec-independent protein translocase protein TatA